jgi:hypothetical protein
VGGAWLGGSTVNSIEALGGVFASSSRASGMRIQKAQCSNAEATAKIASPLLPRRIADL